MDDQGIGARFLRRKAEGPLERGGEVAGMFVAGVERDLANRKVSRPEPAARLIQPEPLTITGGPGDLA